MTLPLAASERQRPSRSCLGCRSQKHKCSGGIVSGSDTVDAVADSKCDRCKRLSIDCVFAGLKRIGRPRRLAPGIEPAGRTLKLGTQREASTIPTSTSTTSTTKLTKPKIKKPITSISTSSTTSTSTSNNNKIKKIINFSSGEEKMNIINSNFNLTNSGNNLLSSSPSTSTSNNTIFNPTDTSSTTFNSNYFNNNNLLPSSHINTTTGFNNLQILNNISTLPNSTDLSIWSGHNQTPSPLSVVNLNSINNTASSNSSSNYSPRFNPTTLFQSPLPNIRINPVLPPFDMLALAQGYLTSVHPFLSLFSQPTAHEIASHLANSTPILSYALSSLLDGSFQFAPPPESFGSSIADLQAGLLVIYGSHGRGESVYARENTKWIADRMMKQNWHLVDNLDARVLLSEVEKQDVRKIWWETWSVDILLGIVTGSRNFSLQGIHFDVHLTESMDAASTLKIRAISLLLACTEPPPLPPQTFPATRTPALTSLGSTIYVLSYAAYTAQPNLQLSIQDQIAARESAFMAILISSASSIYHLSSSSAFSSYIASAFPCGLDTLTPHPFSKNSAIRMASNQMFDLVKMDSLPDNNSSPFDLRSRTNTSTSAAFPSKWDPNTTSTATNSRQEELDLKLKSTTHSPFYSCAVFVAAHGALLTFGLDDAVNETGNGNSNGEISCSGNNNNNNNIEIVGEQDVLQSIELSEEIKLSSNSTSTPTEFGYSNNLLGGGRDIELCNSERSNNRSSFSSTSSTSSPPRSSHSFTSPELSDSATSPSSSSTTSATSPPPFSPLLTNSTSLNSKLPSTATISEQEQSEQKQQKQLEEKILQGRVWRAVEVRSQLDLADFVLAAQSKRYSGVKHIRNEVKTLRMSKSGMNDVGGMLLTGM